MLRMKAGLGTSSAIAPSVPIDRTFVLYETWCYLGLLRAVAEEFPHCRPGVSSLLAGCVSPNALGATLAQGSATRLELTSNVTMTYQRRFSPAPSEDGSRTLVVESIPDVTFARTNVFGQCESVVVLDPKYRKGISLNDGIRDMHVYRDAIVGGNANRLTRAAVILAPRPLWLTHQSEDLPQDAPAALAMRPGQDPLIFQRALRAAVQALS